MILVTHGLEMFVDRRKLSAFVGVLYLPPRVPSELLVVLMHGY